jgi:hypothetical protein
MTELTLEKKFFGIAKDLQEMHNAQKVSFGEKIEIKL